MEKLFRFAWDYLVSNPRLVALRLDNELKVVEAGQGCVAALGFPPEELVGRGLYQILIMDPEGHTDRAVESGRFTGEMLAARDANDRRVDLIASFFRDRNGAVLVAESVQQAGRNVADITLELHKKAFTLAKSSEDLRRRNAYLELANRQIRDNQVTDPTTGLYRRNHLDRLLRAEWERTKRHGADLAFMLISVDGLPALRELQGTESADRVARGVARVLENRKRIFDILGHFDIDSFFLILPHTSLNGARELADRLLVMLRNREIRAGDYPFRISLSIGVSCYHPRHFPVKGHDELIHIAADARTQAQLGGGDQLSSIQTPVSNLRAIL